MEYRIKLGFGVFAEFLVFLHLFKRLRRPVPTADLAGGNTYSLCDWSERAFLLIVHFERLGGQCSVMLHQIGFRCREANR